MFKNVLLTNVVLFDTIDTRRNDFKHTFKTTKMGNAHTQNIFEIKLFSKINK